MSRMVLVIARRLDAHSRLSTAILLRRLISDFESTRGLPFWERFRWWRQRRATFLLLLSRISKEAEMLLDIAEAGNAESLDAIWKRRLRLRAQLLRIRALGELHFSGLVDVRTAIAAAYRGLQVVNSSNRRSAFMRA